MSELDLQLVASERGGKLLKAPVRFKANALALWKCKCGNEWESRISDVFLKQAWCPSCGIKNSTKQNRKYLFQDASDYAQQQKGRCITAESIPDRSNYIGNVKQDKLEWECKEGHRWKARFFDIKSGHWCPSCLGKSKITIQEARKLAIARGGKLLSKRIVNSKSKIWWQCADGHQWRAVLTDIKSGRRWCPVCSSSRGEYICRSILEQMLKIKLPSTFPIWLSYEGKRLQLDGYNQEHKIAFEYQGIQHYQHIKWFGNEEKFFKQRIRDKVKQEICTSNGVVLLTIREFRDLSDKEEIISHVARVARDNGKLPLEFDRKTILLPLPQSKLRLYKEIALSWSGKFVSSEYLGAHAKHRWRCKEGHEFNATLNRAKTSWCKECYSQKKNFRFWVKRRLKEFKKETKKTINESKLVKTSKQRRLS